MSNREKAAAHAAKAEELLEQEPGSGVRREQERQERQIVRTEANAHATLAVYYRDLPDSDG